MAEDKHKFLDDKRKRNADEEDIGKGKRRLELGLIREKIAISLRPAITLNVLSMNLEKLLELF